METVDSSTLGAKRSLSSTEMPSAPKPSDTNTTYDYSYLPITGEHKKAVSSVAWAPSLYTPHPLCASASADGVVHVWSVNGNSCPDNVTTAELLQSNYSGSMQNLVTSMSPILSCLGHSRGINQVKWHPTTPLLTTASDDKSLRVWDALTGDALVELRGHDNFVFAVDAWQSLLASASFDETVKIWDIRSGACIRTLPAHSDPVTGVAFNPRDGTCLASASHDGLVRVWDVATGACLKTLLYRPTTTTPHQQQSQNPLVAPVAHVQYSPNARYLLVGTLDSTLRLWSVASNFSDGKNSSNRGNKPIKTFTAPETFQVNKYSVVADFLHNGNIVAGSETGHVTIWNLQTQKVTQSLFEPVERLLRSDKPTATGNAAPAETTAIDESTTDRSAVLAVAAHRSLPLIASGGSINDRSVQFWLGKPQVNENNDMETDEVIEESSEKKQKTNTEEKM